MPEAKLPQTENPAEATSKTTPANVPENTPPAAEAAPGAPARLPFYRRKDVWAVGILLLIALGWLASTIFSPPGMEARVSVAYGEVERTEIIPLGADGTFTVDGAFPVTLEVKDGAIRFIDSQCPDHTCEGFGWLQREGEWALCAPAGVLVTVQEKAGGREAATLAK